MKFLSVIMILIGMNAGAAEFNCLDKNKQSGTLQIDNYGRGVNWYPHRGAKPSAGIAAGIEQAPYSPWKGYRLFRLTHWPVTNDSSWIIAIQPNKHVEPNIVIYYDNDDHPENERHFRCFKTKN